MKRTMIEAERIMREAWESKEFIGEALGAFAAVALIPAVLILAAIVG